jgi:thiosulfate/3-mercaptopyruvate sulfurtransferase
MGSRSPELKLTDGPLVSGDWLQDHLGHPRVRVLDLRGRHPSSPLPHAKRSEHAAGHLPGAVFVDWEHDFIDTTDPVPVQVSDANAFAERAGELGVSTGDLVVTYDDYYGIFAARVAWAFRYYGAESRVLDGGWTTWTDEGRPVSGVSETPERRLFTARPRPRLRRTLADVEAARAGGAVFVDARPRHLFVGETGVPNTGHIPGSRCLPYQELVDGATGLWAAPAAVRRLARDAGIDPDHPPRELIATCGSGVSATVALLALERIGVHADGVYDGSFNEWSGDPSRPVEYGRAVRSNGQPRRGAGRVPRDG